MKKMRAWMLFSILLFTLPTWALSEQRENLWGYNPNYYEPVKPYRVRLSRFALYTVWAFVPNKKWQGKLPARVTVHRQLFDILDRVLDFSVKGYSQFASGGFGRVEKKGVRCFAVKDITGDDLPEIIFTLQGKKDKLTYVYSLAPEEEGFLLRRPIRSVGRVTLCPCGKGKTIIISGKYKFVWNEKRNLFLKSPIKRTRHYSHSSCLRRELFCDFCEIC